MIATFRSSCSLEFYRITILKNFKSPKKVMESFFKIKTFKSLKEVMESFFNVKNFRSPKTVTKPFFSIKTFKSRRKLTEPFFSGHTSLSFHMMDKVLGATFSLSLFTEFIWLKYYFNLHEESCRAHFSKYCKNYFLTTQI